MVNVVEAVQAARARSNLVNTALAKLVHVFGVYAQGAVHHKEVELALLKSLLKVVGRLGGIHVRGGAHRDGDGALDLGRHVDAKTAARVVAAQKSLPVFAEIIAPAMGVHALQAVGAEVQVAGELGDVREGRPDAYMQRVGAGFFQDLGDGLGLLD